jgi:hypothetical protein
LTVFSISTDSSGVLELSRHNQGQWQMLSALRGSAGKLKLPIPTNDGGLRNDAQLDHEHTGSHDQAARRALYLDASQHCRNVWFSAFLPDCFQEELAVSHVGRRARYSPIA